MVVVAEGDGVSGSEKLRRLPIETPYRLSDLAKIVERIEPGPVAVAECELNGVTAHRRPSGHGDPGEIAAGFAAAGGRAYMCASAAEAVQWAERHTGPGDRILVKGSRSAAMDEVVALLEQRFRNTDTSE